MHEPCDHDHPDTAAGDERVYTQAFAGRFNSDAQIRDEFMHAIGAKIGAKAG